MAEQQIGGIGRMIDSCGMAGWPESLPTYRIYGTRRRRQRRHRHHLIIYSIDRNNTNNAEIAFSYVFQNKFFGEVFQEVKYWHWHMNIQKLKVVVFRQITLLFLFCERWNKFGLAENLGINSIYPTSCAVNKN